MVKGISRQVIVVNSQDKKFFDQAIFILSDEAMGSDGITNDMLLKEAKRIIGSRKYKRNNTAFSNIAFTTAGAFAIGAIWLLTVIL